MEIHSTTASQMSCKIFWEHDPSIQIYYIYMTDFFFFQSFQLHFDRRLSHRMACLCVILLSSVLCWPLVFINFYDFLTHWCRCSSLFKKEENISRVKQHKMLILQLTKHVLLNLLSVLTINLNLVSFYRLHLILSTLTDFQLYTVRRHILTKCTISWDMHSLWFEQFQSYCHLSNDLFYQQWFILDCCSHLCFISSQQIGKKKRRRDESTRSGMNGEVGIKRRRRSRDCPS